MPIQLLSDNSQLPMLHHTWIWHCCVFKVKYSSLSVMLNIDSWLLILSYLFRIFMVMLLMLLSVILLICMSQYASKASSAILATLRNIALPSLKLLLIINSSYGISKQHKSLLHSDCCVRFSFSFMVLSVILFEISNCIIHNLPFYLIYLYYNTYAPKSQPTSWQNVKIYFWHLPVLIYFYIYKYIYIN